MSEKLDEEKRRLRAEAKARRAEGAGEAAAEAVAARLLDAVPLPVGAAVSAYWPMGSELDPRPAMRALHARGHPIALPVVVRRGEPLIFRAWRPGDALEPAGFGTRVPGADKAEVMPGVVLAPLLAFDRRGYRLGYGGGFYDRTLAKLRAAGPVLAVGLAYAAQEVARVPHDETDSRLDWIITEREAVRVAEAAAARAE